MLYEKGTVLGSGEIAVSKIVRVPAIMEIEYISRYKEMDARIDFLDSNSIHHGFLIVSVVRGSEMCQPLPQLREICWGKFHLAQHLAHYVFNKFYL